MKIGDKARIVNVRGYPAKDGKGISSDMRAKYDAYMRRVLHVRGLEVGSVVEVTDVFAGGWAEIGGDFPYGLGVPQGCLEVIKNPDF